MLQIVLLLSTVSFAEAEGCKESKEYEQKMLNAIEKQLNPHVGRVTEDLAKPGVKGNPEKVKSLEAYKGELTKFQEATDPAGKIAVLQTPEFKDAYKGAGFKVQSDRLKSACGSLTKFQNAKKAGDCKDVSDAFEGTPFKLSESQCKESKGSSRSGTDAVANLATKVSANSKSISKIQSEIKKLTSSGGGGFVGIVLSVIALVLAGVVGFLGRKKVGTLQQKLEMAEQKIEKLERKLAHVGKQMQEAERNHQEIEEKSKVMFNKTKQMVEDLRGQTGSIQSQVQQPAFDHNQIEHTDPVGDMATAIHEKPKKSGGLKFGGGKKEKPTQAPVSQMVKAFDGFLKIWHDNATVCQKLPGYQRFQTRLIQNADQYRTQLNVASFSEHEAESIVLPMLDLMVRFESELTHISLQLSGRFNNEVQLVHNIIYQGFGGELERNRIGKLKEVRPMFDTVDTSFQSVIDSRTVAPQFKGKVVEIWKVGMINMSGMKLLRRAEVISGG